MRTRITNLKIIAVLTTSFCFQNLTAAQQPERNQIPLDDDLERPVGMNHRHHARNNRHQGEAPIEERRPELRVFIPRANNIRMNHPHDQMPNRGNNLDQLPAGQPLPGPQAEERNFLLQQLELLREHNPAAFAQAEREDIERQQQRVPADLRIVIHHPHHPHHQQENNNN